MSRFDAEQLASGRDAEPALPVAGPETGDAEPAPPATRAGADEGDTLLPGDERVAELRHEVEEIEAHVHRPVPLLRFGPDTFPPPPGDAPGASQGLPVPEASPASEKSAPAEVPPPPGLAALPEMPPPPGLAALPEVPPPPGLAALPEMPPPPGLASLSEVSPEPTECRPAR